MKIGKIKNENYVATVVKITTLLPLEGCDFVQAAIIMGNQVIVGKDTEVGTIGLYFPVEAQLSKEYLSNNNLYRKAELNVDPEKKGYFEENGRIRCVRFRGHKSEGLFMPLSSLNFLKSEGAGLKENDIFDELDGVEICRKYIIKTKGSNTESKKDKTAKWKSKLVDNQFRFHEDTSMLYRNLNRIYPDDVIGITYKIHGTSGISSYVLCKRPIPLREKIGGFLHNIYTRISSLGKQKFRLEDTEYDYIYASRRVIKNEELNPNADHYYGDDIWGIAHEELKPFLQKGMTFYFEIAGYLPNGGMIQKDYDYGCKEGEHKIYIYRITYTNPDGKVYEFSTLQVQDFCRKNGLNPVPLIFYGKAEELLTFWGTEYDNLPFEENFLETIKRHYNEGDCSICVNKVPEEVVVIRKEGLDFEAYKQKSTRFYELETKLLDKGESNIEDEN